MRCVLPLCECLCVLWCVPSQPAVCGAGFDGLTDDSSARWMDGWMHGWIGFCTHNGRRDIRAGGQTDGHTSDFFSCVT